MVRPVDNQGGIQGMSAVTSDCVPYNLIGLLEGDDSGVGKALKAFVTGGAGGEGGARNQIKTLGQQIKDGHYSVAMNTLTTLGMEYGINSDLYQSVVAVLMNKLPQAVLVQLGLCMVPDPISNLFVTPNSANQTLSFNWTEDSANVTGFVIQIATDSGFSNIIDSTTVPGNLHSAVISGLTDGTLYYYRIAATSDCGPSTWTTGSSFLPVVV